VKETIILLALFCVVACEQQKGTLAKDALADFTDARDGKKYKTVKINNQVWMAENLNFNAKGSKCYGEDGRIQFYNAQSYSYNYITLSSVEIQANCAKYGRLYDWYTAMDACPNGWRVPSDDDWDKMYRFVDGGANPDNHPYGSEAAGKHLRAKEGWDNCGLSGSGKNSLCDDTHGFTALPGGYGSFDGNFRRAGQGGYWWSSSAHNSSRYIIYKYNSASYNTPHQNFLFSVRCLQENMLP
jgi:uncharacterized protein (TIGR02145 family)